LRKISSSSGVLYSEALVSELARQVVGSGPEIDFELLELIFIH